MLNFHFPVKPEPKLRARVTSRGAYTPKKTLDAEAVIASIARFQLPVGFTPLTEPLTVSMTFGYERPIAAKKRPSPSVRPDLDNLIKLVKDALNEIVWKDDCIICEIHASKVYMEKEGIYLSVSLLK